MNLSRDCLSRPPLCKEDGDDGIYPVKCPASLQEGLGLNELNFYFVNNQTFMGEIFAPIFLMNGSLKEVNGSDLIVEHTGGSDSSKGRRPWQPSQSGPTDSGVVVMMGPGSSKVCDSIRCEYGAVCEIGDDSYPRCTCQVLRVIIVNNYYVLLSCYKIEVKNQHVAF